jgi:uncharacterized membrane protein
MILWKTLHVLSMVTMVTMFIGAETFYAAAIWRRDGHALAWVQRTVEKAGIGIIGMLGILAGIVFGLLTAATGGFDFTAGWLIVAYILVVAFFVNSFTLGMRLVNVAKAAVEAEDAGRQADEALRDEAPNQGAILVTVNALLFAAIIADMVAKPF